MRCSLKSLQILLIIEKIRKYANSTYRELVQEHWRTWKREVYMGGLISTPNNRPIIRRCVATEPPARKANLSIRAQGRRKSAPSTPTRHQKGKLRDDRQYKAGACVEDDPHNFDYAGGQGTDESEFGAVRQSIKSREELHEEGEASGTEEFDGESEELVQASYDESEEYEQGSRRDIYMPRIQKARRYARRKMSYIF